ncbi:four helix bundle protein [Kordia algicida OT-1]|uniref:Intervening sequence, 23S rRNA n=1 Tax=Kordia algicida OT-1 TaxID=391587 RepID=A9DP73_9FLAO|nr:four helix bundle protein [Kordia algicida]EDP97369.1 intervening sequence, 23S rRNA [Kordia algicida OT-1]
MENKSYRDLHIYKKAFKLSLETHEISLSLPKYELYEQGSQVRRSSKSITANIVEGYGRKRYKADFIKFLVYAQASCDETINHLHCIAKIHNKESEINSILKEYDILGRQINKFITYVDEKWNYKTM